LQEGARQVVKVASIHDPPPKLPSAVDAAGRHDSMMPGLAARDLSQLTDSGGRFGWGEEWLGPLSGVRGSDDYARRHIAQSAGGIKHFVDFDAILRLG
jgi:hypothetical protein